MSSILSRLRNRRANPAADPQAVTGGKAASDGLHLPRTRVGAWLGRPMTSFHLIVAVTAL
ncbi:MAG: putative lipid II flippase FtsW, partial [Mycolicibacterium sp.]